MAKRKHLAGAAHDIAHHASSGLSYLSPHMAKATRQARIETVTVNLLSETPYPQGVADLEPLQLALKSLHLKAANILHAYGFELRDLTLLNLQVTPDPSDEAGYTLRARVILSCDDGKHFGSGWL